MKLWDAQTRKYKHLLNIDGFGGFNPEYLAHLNNIMWRMASLAPIMLPAAIYPFS